jgi:uncharacterized integral membrane protein (TIGR00698 family)
MISSELKAARSRLSSQDEFRLSDLTSAPQPSYALSKKSLAPSEPYRMISRLLKFVPGILLCIGLTLVAAVLEAIEVRLLREPYLEALVLAIILGVVVRSRWTPGSIWNDGIQFSSKILLEIAVVLLGGSISVATVVALGPILLFGISGIVAVAIATSYAICRGVGLPKKMSVLIACGNSICGNSAIAAVAPIIGADGDDVASSIAFTAVLGVVVVLGLPLLVPVLALSLVQYGILAGLTVYAVPQVLAATLPIGALSNQIGTVVKLVRVLMLGPVVLGLSFIAGQLRSKNAGSPKERRNPGLFELVPWFIIGFLLVAALRSMGMIPAGWLKPIATAATALTTISMAALGLGVDVNVVAGAGLRVVVAVTASLVVLALMSLALIYAIGTP